MRKAIIELIYFDAGGGHRSAMEALSAVLRETYPSWTIVPVDLQQLLEPADPVYRVTSVILPPFKKLALAFDRDFSGAPVQSQTVYNGAIKRGYTHGFGLMLRTMQRMILQKAPLLETLLRGYWQKRETQKPDLVVSLIPNFNGVLFRALESVYPDVPYATIMTDLFDVPPHFWMEDQDQTIICSSPIARQQAEAAGFYAPGRIIEVSGLILKNNFYRARKDYKLRREDIGLDPALPAALVMFGGNGSLQARKIVLQLSALKRPVQSIVLCGKNMPLAEMLHGISGCHAVGFTDDVASYMRLADFFIGKPGATSVSEALHMGCPLIVERNARTMPQERPNADWIEQTGFGIAVKSLSRGIKKPVRRMLDNLPAFRENIRSALPENRAVFEIAALLPELIEQGVAQDLKNEAHCRKTASRV